MKRRSYFNSSHFNSVSSSTSSSSADSARPSILSSPSPSPSVSSSHGKERTFAPETSMLVSMTDTFGGVDGIEDEEREGDEDEEAGEAEETASIIHARRHRPTASNSSSANSHSSSTSHLAVQIQPLSRAPHKQRFPTWIIEAVAPLAEFIADVDPHQHFVDLQEIAEGDSGSVYAARVVSPLSPLPSPSPSPMPSPITLPNSSPPPTHIAIKNIPLPPSSTSPGSSKIRDLARELRLLKGVRHAHILGMDAVYVDLVDDSLWIRMELMERSLADVVGLVCEGLSLQERMIARFASDVLMALDYLQQQHIAHRDVRSDNLLLNSSGIVKLADFSNAIRVSRNAPTISGVVGVIYWQAPEMRAGSYNALNVDAWSLGATVWELAQTEPPFADVQDVRQIGTQWPPLRHPELYSRAFHDFLKLCSRPSASRPNPNELLNTPFIRNACGRAVNIQLLSQCRAIEEHVMQREGAAIDS
ncbi:kinase-like domain-containing protein [Hygrophoropsis aurantiaca]|uniref:Kinase-like domain-containing protein n=1 Tax=Hygrophoropsis aurantiaca TaxID=72124 RepID=A0ACB8A6K5_9AGAM|nr:kinase-like domain-containing protein [Hygrophoropsis aurantiaca]